VQNQIIGEAFQAVMIWFADMAELSASTQQIASVLLRKQEIMALELKDHVVCHIAGIMLNYATKNGQHRFSKRYKG
jgi:hypothetical protein